MATVRFCQNCSNMLYPRVDNEHSRLMYACRNCEFEEVAESNCVFRHEVLHTPSEKTMAVVDLGEDPTLPRTNATPCPRCNWSQAVYFQSQSRHPDTRMTLYYVCCNTKCQHRWQS
ncbi:DNA-directed RNA polymerase II core subunit rpb9 [Coemansia javaensis]|uniref:DNA-directed RNA polymerase subunit n=1 Tax=Coemansia javaensis TaxID=2761396 RepID=A0A9W8HKY7_9FUNG|nr:DNA-directed RNA polymerase II core subunit rpb9 [Coemansia javaensis]